MTPDPSAQAREALVDRILLDYLESVDAGKAPDQAAILAQYPEVADALRSFFEDQDQVLAVTGALATPNMAGLGRDSTTEEPPTRDTDVPEWIGGYRLLRFLGEGGMGRVYEAADSAGHHVAIKLLVSGLSASSRVLERFRQEGRLASRIAHPRCVFVRAADEDAGRPYIVMELMTGATLKDLVERDGPLEPSQAVARILDVIEGLEEAHRAGVLHRDIKPGNCYLDTEGRVKVGDFGLARSLVTSAQLTRPGGFVGTPLFASPEQLRGEKVDERTDVYSVSATLYYLLTGQAPFQHDDAAAVIARVVSEPPRPPRLLQPKIPPALENVVLRGLERLRERRHPTLADLRADLLPFLPGGMTIAGLGLRIGAHFLDIIPFSVLAEIVMLGMIRMHGVISPWYYASISPPLFFYFFLGDWCFGGTLGKRLMGLRVTTASGWERPSAGASLLRTLAFLTTGGLVTDLLLFLVLDSHDLLYRSILSLVGATISVLIRFSTMRKSNGYRALHELVSGTRVVLLPTAQRLPSRPESENLEPPLLPRIPDLPERLGSFVIRGALRWDDTRRILAGEDAALGRRVWLILRSPDEGPPPPARQALGRPARLRWLSSGAENTWTWDAYVAPVGLPLAAQIARSGPLGWPGTRRLLDGILREVQDAWGDGTLPSPLSIEQIWIDASGRLTLLDIPLTHSATEKTSLDVLLTLLDVPLTHSATEKTPLDVLRATASLGLEARPDEPNRVPRGPIPLHARTFLERLHGHQRPFSSLQEAAAHLAATADRPVEVTPTLRTFHSGLFFTIVFFSLTVMLAWSRNGILGRLLVLDRELLIGQVLQEILASEEHIQDLQHALAPEDPLARDSQGYLPLLEELRREDYEAYQESWKALGWHESMHYLIPHVQHRVLVGDKPERLEMTFQPVDGYFVRVRRSSFQGTQNAPFDDIWIKPHDLSVLAVRARGETPDYQPRVRFALMLTFSLTLAILPTLFLVSAFLWRGSFSFLLSGLALVRSDGQRAGRLRCAWRMAVIWLPVLGLLCPILWIDLYHPTWHNVVPLFQGAAILFLTTLGALALRSPRRSFPDVLAGTFLVPR